MRGCRTAGAALCGLLLCACMDNRVYVRTDNSPGALFGISHLQPAKAPPALMDLGVSFKSAGVIVPSASDVLYQTMRDGLAKSRWTTRRLGDSARDFSDEIRAIVAAPSGTQPQPGAAAMPRMLVLVENAPDLSGGTQTRYFLSGMTFGAWSLAKPTDRYDVTVAYRDPQGVERVYRSHQDLLFSTGSKLFGRDEQNLQGLKHYDTPTAAFKGVVDNSVYGARHGTVTAGMPRFDTPRSTTPALQPAAKVPPQAVPAPSVAPQAATPRPAAPLPAIPPAPNVPVIVPAQTPKSAAPVPAAQPAPPPATAPKPAAQLPAVQHASNVVVIVPAQTPKSAAPVPAAQPAPPPATAPKPAAPLPAVQHAPNVVVIVPAQIPKSATPVPAAQPAPPSAAPPATAPKPAAQLPATQHAPNVIVIVPAQTPQPVTQPQAARPAPQPAAAQPTAKPAAPPTTTATCGTGKTGSCPTRP